MQKVEPHHERQWPFLPAVAAQMATNAPHPIGHLSLCLHKGPTRACNDGSQGPVFAARALAQEHNISRSVYLLLETGGNSNMANQNPDQPGRQQGDDQQKKGQHQQDPGKDQKRDQNPDKNRQQGGQQDQNRQREAEHHQRGQQGGSPDRDPQRK
jgi:hypothetical protein